MNWKDLFDSRKVRTAMIAIVGIYLIATAGEPPDQTVTLWAIGAIAAIGLLHIVSQTVLDYKHPKTRLAPEPDPPQSSIVNRQ